MPQNKKDIDPHRSVNESELFTRKVSGHPDILKLFLDSADHVVTIKDTSLRYVTVNKSFLNYGDFKCLDQIVGKTTQEVYHGKAIPEKISLVDHYDKLALKLPKGEHIAFEVALPNQNGEVFTFLAKRFPIFSASNKLVGVGAIAADITERKIIEHELERVREELKEHNIVQEKTLHDANENLQFMNHVFKNTLDGVIITDATGAALQINPSFTEITGYTFDEIVGENPRILKSDYHDDSFYQEMWKSLLKTGKWDGELWNRRKNGEIYPQRLSISAIYDSDGIITHYVGVNNDVSELKRKEEKINFYAYHDALTNLPNRRLFSDRLRTEIVKCAKNGCQLALLYIDFDDFKKVNDSLGYSVGDELLKVFTERIKETISQSDLFARIGSDEFAIGLVNYDSINSLMSLSRKIKGLFLDPFKIQNHDIFLNASIGISTYPDDADTPELLLQHADTAMHQMKLENGNGGEVRFYTTEMQVRAQNKIDMESAIRKGLANGEFVPFYQAKINSITGKIYGMEALARWVKKDGEIIPPNQFIDIAENLNLIGDIDNQILQIALRDMETWEKAGHDGLIVSVNVSAKELEDLYFTSKIISALSAHKVNHNQLEIEITESLIMKNVEKKISLLNILNSTGIQIAIDDFGTGYSSLSYLKTLPIHTLKIDRSFINDISDDENDMAIVSAIISMASKMGLEVIAEGVEQENQITLLRNEGCNLIQGFYYTKPLPKSDFLTYLNDQNS
ncbi:sensor domain-containing protein [Maridesulfovibrio frigidus]|uniref:sensor domain-containing protein n=1 Tax=Maridesulfovibrio frigidus TaxID=340956 RepID=UPI00069235C9|nr:EAL domain-containing protein [Maridesulfovibrio frigidus]